MSTTVTYKGSTLTTAENQTKKLKTSGKYMEDDVTIVDVTSGGNLQSKSFTIPYAGTVNIEPDEGYDGMTSVAVTTPVGYTTNPVIFTSTYTESGVSKYSMTPAIDFAGAGWINELGWVYGTSKVYTLYPSNSTITPSESVQTIGGSDYILQDSITIDAIPSNYVGSNVPRGDDNTMSLNIDDSDATVVAASGYYANNAEKVIPVVSANPSVSFNQSTGLITATETFASSGYVLSGTYSASTQVSVMTLPSETSNTYVGSEKASVFPSTSEPTYLNIPSGYHSSSEYYRINTLMVDSKSITSNGTYHASDDDLHGYTDVYVNVSAPTPQTQSKSATPTESAQTITPDAGYYLSEVSVGAISSSYVGSSIPRRNESNVLIGEGQVGVMDGYYGSSVLTQIPSGSLYGTDTISVEPSIVVDNNGLISVSGQATRSVTPVSSEGWITTSQSMVMYAYAASTYQLTLGNSIGYGITDGTLPLVGVAKAGYAEI